MLYEFSEGVVKPGTILLIHHLFVNVGNGVPKWHLPEISHARSNQKEGSGQTQLRQIMISCPTHNIGRRGRHKVLPSMSRML